MSDRKSLADVAKKRNKRSSAGKEAAIEEAGKKDDYLGPNVHNGRFDVDKRLHRSLKNLAMMTTSPENQKGSDEIKFKSVSMRMLMTEALLDLFDKYERGEGKYPFEDEDEQWRFK